MTLLPPPPHFPLILSVSISMILTFNFFITGLPPSSNILAIKSPLLLCAALDHERSLITDKHTEILDCIPCVMVIFLITQQAEPIYWPLCSYRGCGSSMRYGSWGSYRSCLHRSNGRYGGCGSNRNHRSCGSNGRYGSCGSNGNCGRYRSCGSNGRYGRYYPTYSLSVNHMYILFILFSDS